MAVGTAVDFGPGRADACVSFADAETRPPDGLAVLPTCQRNSEGFPGPAAVAACRSSKSPLSSTVRVFGAHPSENIDTSSDTENLKQKIRDLETELQGYRNFLFQLQKHSQCSEAIITVLCGTEGGQDVLSKPKGSADEEEMTFSSLHRVRYVKHMKILRQLAPEVADGGLLEGLRQQLLQQECELQKEQNLNMELFSEIHNLQNKFRDLSPSRYVPHCLSHCCCRGSPAAPRSEPPSYGATLLGWRWGVGTGGGSTVRGRWARGEVGTRPQTAGAVHILVSRLLKLAERALPSSAWVLRPRRGFRPSVSCGTFAARPRPLPEPLLPFTLGWRPTS